MIICPTQHSRIPNDALGIQSRIPKHGTRETGQIFPEMEPSMVAPTLGSTRARGHDDSS